jgi:hypothetical protein
MISISNTQLYIFSIYDLPIYSTHISNTAGVEASAVPLPVPELHIYKNVCKYGIRIQHICDCKIPSYKLVKIANELWCVN